MDKDEVINRLKDVLIKNEVEPTDEMLNNFQLYYEFLIEYNKNVNLTAITSFEDVYIKHFVDSLANCKMYKKNATVCDIGTGAGFPGLVLKIARPDLEVYLVDSLNKRIVFLEKLIIALKNNNARCLHFRAEDVEFKERYLNTFDYVISRAVASMPTLTEYCLPFVKIGGEYIAYKSNDCENELVAAKNCIKMLGGKLVNIDIVNIDNNLIRNIVHIIKIQDTSSKYPRGQNKPRLSPIK